MVESTGVDLSQKAKWLKFVNKEDRASANLTPFQLSLYEAYEKAIAAFENRAQYTKFNEDISK